MSLFQLSYDQFFTGLIIGFLSACLTIFLNYCIGKPGSEFSPYEIFSFYTVWLSKGRLKKLRLYDNYEKEFWSQIGFSKTEIERISIRNDYKKILYNASESFFTWERAVGMCPVCTGFWISLFSGILYTFNFIEIIEIIILSHITIRILNKIL